MKGRKFWDICCWLRNELVLGTMCGGIMMEDSVWRLFIKGKKLLPAVILFNSGELLFDEEQEEGENEFVEDVPIEGVPAIVAGRILDLELFPSVVFSTAASRSVLGLTD